MQNGSNTDLAFFWKTKQGKPCRICGEIEAVCTGQICVLGKSPVSSWWHRAPSGGHVRTQTWAKSHIGQVPTEETQTLPGSGDLRSDLPWHHIRLQWLHRGTWEQRDQKRCWDETSFVGDETWQQEKAAPVTAYSHSSFHWGQDGQQTAVPLRETSPALALDFVLVLVLCS